MVKVVCGCKQLVEVLDRKISEHETIDGLRCPDSGSRYVPQKTSFRGASGLPSGPKLEVLASISHSCDECGANFEFGVARIKVPDPTLN